MKKIIIVLGTLIVLLLSITFINYNTKDKEYMNKEIKDIKNTNVIAAYVIQEDGTYKQVSDIPQSGYQINTEKSTCSNGSTPTGVVPNITINNLSKNGTSCYLYFDKYEPPITISDIIASASKGSGTPTFSKTSCTSGCEETTVGTYTIADPVYGGTTTYWRGDVTDNYVKFANFCWRIIRINGDGSLRLIYDGTTCHANGITTIESIAKTSIAYNTSYNNSSYVGWTYTVGNQRPSPSTGGTASNAKTQLESWYSSNITGINAENVAEGKYCNDRTVGSGTWSATGSEFRYGTYTRLNTNRAPNLACNTSDVYTLKVGLITVDETMYAGGRDTNNQKYYLYNGQNYWTMSPCIWSGSEAGVFFVYTGGNLSWTNVVGTIPGLRPVINLKSDTLFATGGNGTLDNPYVVS